MIRPLKFCYAHGSLFRDHVVIAKRTPDGKTKWRCKQCLQESHKKHYLKHREKVRESHLKYRKENPEKVRISKQKSQAKSMTLALIQGKSLEELKRIQHHRKKKGERTSEETRVSDLTDNYIKNNLTKRNKTIRNKITPDLIETKRVLLKLHRMIKYKRDIRNINLMIEAKENEFKKNK